MQLVLLLAPDDGLYVPREHFMQLSTELFDAYFGLNVPVLQSVQIVHPENSQNEPGIHAIHD
jgi:hypothetical protein